ncbi:unnamed protein product [Paramecium primaurelia]|uniref:P-loop containing nucleoside triphosphate hydrolase n=1 Tax=Paramecium primaurelia TaxID=5886 RepID=A0A8S1P5C9_PARPR|nr:unnamed protein product [Paramecium primaurelia]
MAEKNIYKILALASAFTFTSASVVVIYFGMKLYYEKKKMPNKSQKFQTLKYLLVGPPGVGKTKLFKRISNFFKQKQVNQGFEECQIRHDIDLVSTPSFEFENINEREIIIKQFSQYMMKNHIIHFFLLVNFERTDLMKKKILNVLKYFKKFKEKFTVIVTDFQLSDNQEEDKKNLKQALHVYLNQNQSIMFVENDFNVEQFRDQLLVEAQALNLTDTIFEPINENEQQLLLQQFQNMFTNRDCNQIKKQQINENNNQQQEIILTNTQQDNIQQQQQENEQFQINDQKLFQDDQSILMNDQFKSNQNQQ